MQIDVDYACAILFLMFVCLNIYKNVCFIRLRVSLHICQSKCWLCWYDCFDDVYIFIWLCLYSPRIFFLVFFFSTIIFFSFLRLCLYSPRIFNHICIHIYIHQHISKWLTNCALQRHLYINTIHERSHSSWLSMPSHDSLWRTSPRIFNMFIWYVM